MAAVIGSGGRQSDARFLVVLVVLACYIANVSAQGLILVPESVTRELGGYYLSKLGLAANGMDYYSTLAQRNIRSNAYNWVNDIADTETPQEAAAKLSNVRGVHTAHSLGGKISVESFYRLLRCEDAECFVVNKLVVSDVVNATGGLTVHALSTVKTTMGNTGWTINAPQSVVNSVLAQYSQLPYVDPVYQTKLFYKVATRPPRPCSSATIHTQGGSLSEFAKVPGFACINYNGTVLLVGTGEGGMSALIERDAVPFSQCDGSLGLLYVKSGPRIVRLLRTPGQVPIGVVMDLPAFRFSKGECLPLYETPDLALQAAAEILAHDFVPSVDLTLENLPSIENLGFTRNCPPSQFAIGYGLAAIGQNEALTDGSNNEDFIGAFVPYNSGEACVAMFGINQPDFGTIEYLEDRCALQLLGNDAQKTEGVVTALSLEPDAKPTDVQRSRLQKACADPEDPYYLFDVAVVLPQIAADFETDKDFLVSSTEVKTHLDGVAANAASVLAVEAALATSGIVVARMIARTGLYRRRRVPSNLARALALFLTAVIVTLFNVPNFALISRSLANHGKTTVYTQASLLKYRPTNFSAVIMAETHSFVEVTGSSATAIIGLLLYTATLVFCLYLTWVEFTEIIHRREAAESRLGQDALIADKDLLVQWRGTDSIVYDTLHPKKVVENAQAQELEIFRRNLAISNSRAQSPQAVRQSPRATPVVQRTGHAVDLYSDSRRQTPDLYSEV